MLDHLAYNWFLLFYSVLGLLLLIQGVIWALNPAPFYDYLRQAARLEKRPPMLLKSARYVALFATASLVFGFLQLSVIDIVFSMGLAGLPLSVLSYLARWDYMRPIIAEHPEAVKRFLRLTGYFSISTALVLALLVYRLLVF